MKLVKRIGTALSVPAVIFLVVGLSLPRKFRVERSIAIAAPPEAIYPVVAKLHEWPTWTAWTQERFPDMKMEFSGPESGVGAKQSWQGKSSGSGKIEITKAEPAEGIDYAFAFEDKPSVGGIKFSPGSDGSTLVRWHSEGDLGYNPISRYFGLLMDRFMGPDFEQGLSNLKRKVETAQTEKPPATESPAASS